MVFTSHDKLGDTDTKVGWYLPEAAHPYHVFKKAGWKIQMASIKGGEAPCDPASLDMNDEWNKLFWEDPTTRGLT